MAHTIFWTKRAHSHYKNIISHLNENWGSNTAISFQNKTSDFLSLLSEFPQIGTIEVKSPEIRGFQMTKQIRVFYRIKDEKIILLALFDTRKHPSQKFNS